MTTLIVGTILPCSELLLFRFFTSKELWIEVRRFPWTYIFVFYRYMYYIFISYIFSLLKLLLYYKKRCSLNTSIGNINIVIAICIVINLYIVIFYIYRVSGKYVQIFIPHIKEHKTNRFSRMLKSRKVLSFWVFWKLRTFRGRCMLGTVAFHLNLYLFF